MTHVRQVTPILVAVADGRVVSINQMGNLRMRTVVENGNGTLSFHEVTIPNVHFVPGLSVTLLSVSQLVQEGNVLRFAGNEWSVTKGKVKKEVMQAEEVNGVYEVMTPESLVNGPPDRATSALAATAKRGESLASLHRRLGHLD